MPPLERMRRAAGAHPLSGGAGARRSRTIGYGAALAAAGFAGLIPVLSKRDLGPVDPLLVAGFNNLFAGLIILPLAAVPRFTKPDAKRLLFIALAGAVVAPVLYFVGLRSTTASEGAMLVNAETVFTLTLALVILRERAGPAELAAVAGIVLGAVILTTDLRLGVDPAHVVGNLLVVAASAVWAFDNMVSAGLARRNAPQAVAAWKNLIGSSIVLMVALSLAADFSTIPSRLPSIFLVGGIGTGVSLTLFYVSMRRIDAYRTSAIFGLQGLFGVVGGYAFVGERLSPVQLGAAALMLAAVLFLAWRHRGTEAAPTVDAPPTGST